MLKLIIDPLYQLVISGMVIIAIYFPMLTKLVHQWSTDENYSHGFIIPVISVYLIYAKREKLKQLAVEQAVGGLVITALGMMIYIIGVIGADLFTQRFSFLTILVGSIICLLGYKVFKEISFPIFYLLFMIPLPYVIFYAIAAPLKLFAANASVAILKEAGLPIMNRGHMIYMPPDIKLAVAYACSGLRSLISLTALGAVFGYYTQTKLWKRLFVFGVTVPIAIISNIIRIMSACLLAFVYGEEVATGFLHDFSGVVVFAVAVFLLTVIGGLLWEKSPSTSSS